MGVTTFFLTGHSVVLSQYFPYAAHDCPQRRRLVEQYILRFASLNARRSYTFAQIRYILREYGVRDFLPDRQQFRHVGVTGEAFDYATWQHTDGGRYLYGGAVPASYDLSEMWTGPGDTNAKLPKFQYGSASTTASSRWLMPTDYLRLKSLTIGFSAPTSFISKLGLTKARAYFSGSNLLTWKSKDLVVDPEMSPSGIMTFETPAYRTFAFGVELDF